MADEIIGRVHELDAVAQLLDAATELRALVLEGDGGIGKSTVWEAAVATARARGWLVLTTRPSRSESGLTLGGLTDLLGGLDDVDFEALPSPQRRALGVALLRLEPVRGSPNASPDQRTLSVAVAGVLRQLAQVNGPLLVAIDDAQWVDESSAAIIAYALRRLWDQPVGVLAAVRSGAETPASDGVLGALPADRSQRLHLGPMHLAELHRLFLARLGRSFPRLALVRIEEASGGNPLYALELGRAMIRAGNPDDPKEALPLPESLGSLIGSRVSLLPRATRGALLLAAAAAEPTVDMLERASPGFRDDLRAAVDDRLVALDRGVVRFTHPLFSQSVASLAGAEELRAAHALLAASTPSADARARHLAHAADGPDEAVALALAEAAGNARFRGATLDAAGLYQEAARLTPDDEPDLRIARSRLAAECLFVDLSEYLEADRILEEAIDRAPPGPARADAFSLRAIIRYYHGRVPEAIALGEQGLGEAGGEPALRAKVLGRLAYLAMQLDLERGLTLVDEAVTLLEREAANAPVDRDTLANALLLRAVGEIGLVRPTRSGDVERGLALLTTDGRSWEREGAEGSAFGIVRLTDDLDRAIAMTHETIRTKSGPGGDDPFNVVMLSGLLLFRGDWPEARRQAEAAMDGYQREGAEVHPSWALRGLALVAAHDGRAEDARQWSTRGLEEATSRGDLVLTVFHHHILGFLDLTAEAWREADAHLTEAAALAARIGVRHPGRFKLAGDQVEAALALGDVERAAAVVGQLDEAGAVAPTPWVLAVGARSAALLSAARGDLDEAAMRFDRALAEHDRLPMPFERARTLLAKGRLHRRRKQKRLADETLREALACFEQVGAPDWAAKARSELARVGRRPHAPETLTETELRVAELAATGLSNREVAERAFLAPKTVGNVLGRVYEKLGIHSRAELGAVMAAIAATADLANRATD